LGTIHKETAIIKSDKKSHIRKCMFTGQLLLVKSILGMRNISVDILMDIFKILGDLLQQQVVEEGVLFTLDNFIDNFCKNYYQDLNAKKISEKVLRFFDSHIVSKTNPKNIVEFSLVFILTKYSLCSNNNLSLAFKNYLPNNIIDVLLDEKVMFNYLKIILTNKPRENDFHISFNLLFEVLKAVNDFKKIVNVWNVLIDPEMQGVMKTTSLKNYQSMVYLVSKFILENYFDLVYMKEIFDHSYFESMLKFATKHKFKYISSLLDIIQHNLKDHADKEMVSLYSYNLLNIFGNDATTGISPQSYKGLFLFLFRNLSTDHRNSFIDSFTNEDDSDDDDIESVQFKTTVMRILLTTSDIDDDTRARILNYLLMKFYNTQNEGIELESLLSERTLASILLLVNDIKDSKLVKNLLKIHKTIQKLFKDKSINIELEDYEVNYSLNIGILQFL
jgi:hypothetical protein